MSDETTARDVEEVITELRKSGLTNEVVMPDEDCPGCGRTITSAVTGDYLHGSRWCIRCGGWATVR